MLMYVCYTYTRIHYSEVARNDFARRQIISIRFSKISIDNYIFYINDLPTPGFILQWL